MRNEKGFGIIEVIIAIALLGIIGVGFLGALSTASKAIFTTDERATAESLARSQMEYVKNQDYIIAPDDSEVTYDKINGIPEGYTIWSFNRAGDAVENIIGVPWDSQSNQPLDTDAAIQRMKLLIKHHGEEVITLEGYKANR